MSNTNFTHPSEEELSAYIDDMLDVHTMLGVTIHLEECEICSATCGVYRDNRARLRRSPDVSAESAAFWAGAYARLQEEPITVQDSTAGAKFQTKKPRFASLRALYGTAATIVAAAILISSPVGQPHRTPHPAAPPHIAAPVVAADEADALDVSQLVRAHTSAASQQPLADQERQAMIAAENDEGAGNDLSRPELGIGAESVL